MQWPLATKLFAIGCAFLTLALASIATTLWVSWQLEGGAGAVNEAGRMRMQAYRLALARADGAAGDELGRTAAAMDAIFERLHAGEPARPLAVPWNADTRARFADLRERWSALGPPLAQTPTLAQVDDFVARIDGFVGAIERQLSGWTTTLRSVQLALMALAVASTMAFFYTGHLFVIEPLQRLRRAVARVGAHDFSARVEARAADEFGEVAQAFNGMAEQLQTLYRELEDKVAEKTARLEVKRERLAALYEVSAFIAAADALPELAGGFAQRVRQVVRADGAVLRWSDSGNERYLMLAADGLPAGFVHDEQCLATGTCHCGQAAARAETRVVPITAAVPGGGGLCERLGHRMLVSVPIRLHEQVLGEIDLLFQQPRTLEAEERTLIETLAGHLASRMEGLRAAELQREAAVTEERNLIARELHDSIAQSLAFLKIQVSLLKKGLRQHREATVETSVGELESGVQECYADVRELLLHFRTRACSEDLVGALRATLSKFELSSGLKAQLETHGHGVPPPADVQIQVLHVVQEALSNVRKHAGAHGVTVTLHQAPRWRVAVHDDGCGFDPAADRAQSHVGLDIMRERAARIGAELRVESHPHAGTTVTLTLPCSTTIADHERSDTPAGR